MTNIAFFHNALGKTDGVSLEVDKWKFVLEQMGHKVFYCAGNCDNKRLYCIPELNFNYPQTQKILVNSTVKLTDYSNQKLLEKDILEQAELIKNKILKFINSKKIDILIPNNLLSVGYHLPALIALSQVIEEAKLPTIAHNHDFYFENSGEVTPTCTVAKNILEKYSTPRFSNVQNLVINRIAQKALKKRKRIDAQIVPNVFDFSHPLWGKDNYNANFRQAIGVEKNDIIFLQATRIMDRKGIELAIRVLGELNKSENLKKLHHKKLYDGRIFSPQNKLYLICSGRLEKFGITNNYQTRLKKLANKLHVKMKFVHNQIGHSRGIKNGRKIYSLWDSYAAADFVTYPSWWEGWGNQFIEAVFAKLPVLLFEYPVYQSDLKQTGFKTVSLGNKLTDRDEFGLVTVHKRKITEAAQKIINLLTDNKQRRQMVNRNFLIAKKKFSYPVLKKIIEGLLKNIH